MPVVQVLEKPIDVSIRETLTIAGVRVMAKDIYPLINGRAVYGVLRVVAKDTRGKRTIEYHLHPNLARPELDPDAVDYLVEVVFRNEANEPVTTVTCVAAALSFDESLGRPVLRFVGEPLAPEQ